LNSIGVPTNNNPVNSFDIYLLGFVSLAYSLRQYGGQATGVYNVRRNVDIATGTRSTAAEAYLTPSVSARNNLQILTGAHVRWLFLFFLKHIILTHVHGRSLRYCLNPRKMLLGTW
jgi:hypothetical protein